MTTLAASESISSMFSDMFSATVPVPIVVIIFLAICVFYAVK